MEKTDKNTLTVPQIKIVSLHDVKRRLNQGEMSIAVVDFETNGLDYDRSVVSCGILSFLCSPTSWILRYQATRYYLPREPVDPRACRIHGLSERVLRSLRSEINYPDQFVDDTEITEQLHWADLVVSHNAVFDGAHIAKHEQIDFFCTMRSNVSRLRRKRKNDSYRFPSLSETASYYDIRFDSSSLHRSDLDVQLTAEIFRRMVFGFQRTTTVRTSFTSDLADELIDSRRALR